jgi:hypothetical protein
MCLSCGCGKSNDTHGDDRNITQDDLNRAAQAANISPQQVAQNIADGIRQAGGMPGMGQQASQPTAPA